MKKYRFLYSDNKILRYIIVVLDNFLVSFLLYITITIALLFTNLDWSFSVFLPIAPAILLFLGLMIYYSKAFKGVILTEHGLTIYFAESCFVLHWYKVVIPYCNIENVEKLSNESTDFRYAQDISGGAYTKTNIRITTSKRCYYLSLDNDKDFFNNINQKLTK